jgi:hypothetical protein
VKENQDKSEKVVNTDSISGQTSQPSAGKHESIKRLLHVWVKGQQQVGMKRFGK